MMKNSTWPILLFRRCVRRHEIFFSKGLTRFIESLSLQRRARRFLETTSLSRIARNLFEVG
jgi:hypothetical protein